MYVLESGVKLSMWCLQFMFGYIWSYSDASKISLIIWIFCWKYLLNSFAVSSSEWNVSEKWPAFMKDAFYHIKDCLLISFTGTDLIFAIRRLWCGQQLTSIQTCTDEHLGALILIHMCSQYRWCRFVDWVLCVPRNFIQIKHGFVIIRACSQINCYIVESWVHIDRAENQVGVCLLQIVMLILKISFILKS